MSAAGEVLGYLRRRAARATGAERLLTAHPLRAADALQLSAALLWSRGDTGAHAIVCLDGQRRAAARRDGFAVLPQ